MNTPNKPPGAATPTRDNAYRDPPAIDSDQPNAARVYNVYLGGTANFAADREAAEAAAVAFPGGMEGAMDAVRQNRDVLRRFVAFLVDQGIRQFLDLGTGVPDETNVHAIAQGLAPGSRVVCVDYDPVVLAHSHDLMHSTAEGAATFLNGDFREVDEVVGLAADTLDLDEPVAVLLVALLHLFDDDEDPYAMVRKYMAKLPSGSYLGITHITNDITPGTAETFAHLNDTMTEPLIARTKQQVQGFLDGLELVEPGIAPVNEWHPDADTPAGQVIHWAALARKP